MSEKWPGKVESTIVTHLGSIHGVEILQFTCIKSRCTLPVAKICLQQAILAVAILSSQFDVPY